MHSFLQFFIIVFVAFLISLLALTHAGFFVVALHIFVGYRIQVLANSGIALVLVVAIWVFIKGQDKCLNS